MVSSIRIARQPSNVRKSYWSDLFAEKRLTCVCDAPADAVSITITVLLDEERTSACKNESLGSEYPALLGPRAL